MLLATSLFISFALTFNPFSCKLFIAELIPSSKNFFPSAFITSFPVLSADFAAFLAKVLAVLEAAFNALLAPVLVIPLTAVLRPTPINLEKNPFPVCLYPLDG